MKTIFSIAIVCMAIIDTGFAQGVKAPAVVEQAFRQKFPAAKEVKWDKEGKNEYEAEFTLNGKKGSANFSSKGEWLETEAGIALADAPKKVADGFAKKYPGAAINEVYSIETKDGKHYYEIEYTLNGKKKEAKINP